MHYRLAAAITAPAVGLAMLSTAATAEEFRGWNIHVAGYPNTVAMDRFAELVEEKTDGRITINMFHDGVLGNQPDAIEQVRIGAIEIGNFNLGPIGPVADAANVVSLPFVFRDVEHMHHAMDGEAGDMISASMEEKGLVALAWYDSGARSFYNSVRPIYTVADVEGLKIRVMNNDLYSMMINELGGNPSPMAFAEVYSALGNSVVDGAENNWPSYESTGHFEVAGYYSLSQHLIIPECVCINADVYNGLSEEDQQALFDAARESAVLQRELWEEREVASREIVMAAGVEFNEISPEDKAEFQAAMAPVYEGFFEQNPHLKELVDLIIATE